jgi:hypothetical protein
MDIYKHVTNNSQKEDSDMKIHKTTYKDKEDYPIGLTAGHTSRPVKVFYFLPTLISNIGKSY